MKAMILAAGLGTRLRPVTDKLAKPAVPFLNIPLLYYPLNLLREAGVDSLVINTHYHPEQIEALAHSIPGGGFKVDLSHEPGVPLGSGGGIWKAKDHLLGSGDFLVCNGDEVILPKERGVIGKFLDLHRKKNALATILVMHHPNVGTQFGGVWVDDQGNVKGFGKNPLAFGSGLRGYHYIGLLLLNERVFNYLPNGESNILYDALTAAIAKGEQVQTLVSDFTWFETGNPTDFLHATGESLKLLAYGQGLDAQYLKEICRRFWRPGSELRTTESALILVDPEAQIPSSAYSSGFVVAGRGSVVNTDSRIENAILMPYSQTHKGQVLRDQILLSE